MPNARPARRRRQGTLLQRPPIPYATEPRGRARTGARRHHHHHHIVRVTQDAASASAAGRFGVGVGGKHHGTYVRTHGTGRGETRLDFPRIASIPLPPNAGGPPPPGGRWELLRRKRSERESARTYRHRRAGRRRCRWPFHPLVGAVRRRSRSRNGPRFVVPTCGGRRGRASLLRNQQSRWWKV
ncbi:uncharacterized protein [Miscanthus floridulus]|uniref:uncharacterized protein n=1 Tax=Miscanthus floridulus TaxID=154761 RepID=UPI00345AB103